MRKKQYSDSTEFFLCMYRIAIFSGVQNVRPRSTALVVVI